MRPFYLHTARYCHALTACTTLPCVGTDRALAECGVPVFRVARRVQVAEDDFGKNEVQLFEKN